MTSTKAGQQFRGRQSVKIDPKGRLIVPSQYRAQKSSAKSTSKKQNYFITNNLYRGQRHLDLFPENEWLALEKRMNKLPSLNMDVQAFRRFYLASAVPVSVDAQGRLLVPQELREYAGLNEDVVLLGVGNKLEVWNAAEWQKFQGHVVENFDQILTTVADLEKDIKGDD